MLGLLLAAAFRVWRALMFRANLSIEAGSPGVYLRTTRLRVCVKARVASF